MRSLIIAAVAATLCLFVSCKKNTIVGPPRVDFYSLYAWDVANAKMEAMAVGLTNYSSKVHGFCWAEGHIPTMADTCVFVDPAASLMATVSDLGEGKLFYFRAFVVADKDTFYSGVKRLTTGGFQRLWHKRYDFEGQNIEVKQVVVDIGGFLVLSKNRQQNGLFRPCLSYIDSAGVKLWSRVYDDGSSDDIEPELLKLTRDFYLISASRKTVTGKQTVIFAADHSGWEAGRLVPNQFKGQDVVTLDLKPGTDSFTLITLGYDGIVNGVRTNARLARYNCSISNIYSFSFVTAPGKVAAISATSISRSYGDNSLLFLSPHRALSKAPSLQCVSGSAVLSDLNNTTVPANVTETDMQIYYNYRVAVCGYGGADPGNNSQIWTYAVVGMHTQWTRSLNSELFGSYSGLRTASIRYEESDGFIVAGSAIDSAHNTTYPMMVKFTNSGGVAWKYVDMLTGGYLKAEANTAVRGANGKIYLFGSVQQTQGGPWDLFCSRVEIKY